MTTVSTKTFVVPEAPGTLPIPVDPKHLYDRSTSQKFCPFLSIMGPKRLCDWRECGASHLCRGG